MPRVNIWLPAELHRQVKENDVPISETCQAALRRELKAIARRYPPTPSHPSEVGPEIRRQ